MTHDEQQRLLTPVRRVSAALQHLLGTLTHGEATSAELDTTIADLRTLVATLPDPVGQCLGPEAPGRYCQKPGDVRDHSRGGMLCIEHLPPEVQHDIVVWIATGTLEGDLTYEGKVYSWRLQDRP